MLQRGHCAMFQNGRLTDCQMQVIRIGRYLHRRSRKLLSLSWSLSLLLLLFLLLLVVVVVAVVWCLLFLEDHYHDTASLHPKDLRCYGSCGRGHLVVC